MTSAVEPLTARPLKMDTDPFASNAANHSSRQVQTAFQEIVRQLVQQTPVVLVTGPASAGKTLLVDMTARLCTDMGLSVRRVDRGDLLHIALGQHSDVLLVDEANSVADAVLEAFSPEGRSNTATTTVFLGLPSCVARFISTVNPVLIQFDLLSRSDAEHYLRERATGAGFPDLFSDAALELTVDASRGSPRLLRRIASMAFFNAVSDCAFQIGHKHAASALAMQLPPNSTTHYAKQSVAAEDALFPGVRVDDDRFAPDKASSQVGGLLPGFEAGSNEHAPAAEVALNTDELDKDIWIGTTNENSDARLETSNRQSIARTLMRRGVLAACVATVVAAAAIAVVRPWIRTDPVSSNLAALPQGLPGAAAAPGVFEPAATPVIPNDVENKLKPETVPSAPQNTLQAKKETADSTGAEKSSAGEAAETKAVVPKPLTAEEKAAIVRGIQELERAETQTSQLNRR